jgi:hypothetical protein
MRALLLVALALNPGCTCTDLPSSGTSASLPEITAPFSDDFSRSLVGVDYFDTSPKPAYTVENGELVARFAHNHPLWLRRPIPRNATVEFDCWSNDDAGDLKVEIWGDGKSFSTDEIHQYTSTSYNFVFGGWHNEISTLARMQEHGEDRQTRREPKVVKGKKYHWKIERSGSHVDWVIDGQVFLSFDDPAPLEGDGHRFFAFTDWEAELHFDNLKITPR